MKEDDVAVIFGYVHVQVLHAVNLVFQHGHFVVMGGEQGSDVGRWIAQVLHGSPCNGQTVVGAGASSDFVQNHQAPFPGRTENIAQLAHLHKKRRLALCQIIGRTDSGKDPVADTDAGPLTRHEAAGLCHEHDEGCLAHVGRFTSHVWTGNQQHAGVVIIHVNIVGNEESIGNGLLDDRMTALVDFQFQRVINDRLHIAKTVADLRKGAEHIQGSHSRRCLLNRNDVFFDFVAEVAEQVVLHLVDLGLRIENQTFHLLQFRRDETLSIGQGLLADIVVRNHVVERLGHFQIISKHAVVAHLQVADAGTLPLAVFKARNPVLAVLNGELQVVQLFAVARFNQAPFTDLERRIVHDGRLNQAINFRQRIDFPVHLPQNLRFRHFRQSVFDVRQNHDGVLQGNQVLAVGAAAGNTAC